MTARPVFVALTGIHRPSGGVQFGLQSRCCSLGSAGTWSDHCVFRQVRQAAHLAVDGDRW